MNVDGQGTTTYLELAYHVPAATHPDFFSLMVADSLLSGAGSINMFSSGISNRTSRLYRALVERELAVSIHGGLQATIDPFLYSFTAIIHPESSVEKVIAALETEIQHLMDTPPSQEEIKRAVKQARALFAYGSESITNQAFWLGFSEMIASNHWYENYLAQLEAVTSQDVQSAAQAYLQPSEPHPGRLSACQQRLRRRGMNGWLTCIPPMPLRPVHCPDRRISLASSLPMAS